MSRGPSLGILSTAGTLAHEMAHNLGINHDMEGWDACRKVSDGAIIPCVQCANYYENGGTQEIRPVTGHENDCCNGFMGYGNRKMIWSECSARDFENNYVSRNWQQCMETTSVTYCDSDYIRCLNGGTCKEQQNGFSCECPATHRGKNCEKLDCPTGYKYREGDVSGASLEGNIDASITECAARCSANSECGSFEFDSEKCNLNKEREPNLPPYGSWTFCSKI